MGQVGRQHGNIRVFHHLPGAADEVFYQTHFHRVVATGLLDGPGHMLQALGRGLGENFDFAGAALGLVDALLLFTLGDIDRLLPVALGDQDFGLLAGGGQGNVGALLPLGFHLLLQGVPGPRARCS